MKSTIFVVTALLLALSGCRSHEAELALGRPSCYYKQVQNANCWTYEHTNSYR